MSIDHCTHSLFGVSKAAADLLVQEYGRYFDMPTVCFRGGCLTGPQHAGAQLHGFLAYLMRCTVTGEPYTIFGYGGKQVRDNIHAHDVVRAFDAFHAAPRAGRGLQPRRRAREQRLDARGDRAVRARSPAARSTRTLSDEARIGDHRWWISDLDAFKRDYPEWRLTYGIEDVLREIHDANVERWTREAARDEALGRHPGAQRGGLDRARRSTGIAAALDARGHRLRDHRRRRRVAPTRTATRVARLAEADPNVRCLRSPYRSGFGFAVRAGPRRVRAATPWRS